MILKITQRLAVKYNLKLKKPLVTNFIVMTEIILQKLLEKLVYTTKLGDWVLP